MQQAIINWRLFVLDESDRHGGQQHENGGQGDHGHRTSAEQLRDDQTAGESDDDLRNGDREVEDTHVDPHAARLDGPREDGVGHGQDTGPGDADAHHGDHERILVGEEAQTGETGGAEQQAERVDELVAPPAGDAGDEERSDAGGNGIGAVQHADPRLGLALGEHGAPAGSHAGDGGLEVGPHEEQRGPREELHDAELPHDPGHVAHQLHERGALGRLADRLVVILGELLGRILAGAERGDEHRGEQNGATYIIGPGDMLGDLPGDDLVGDAAAREDQRQDGPDDGAEVDQKGLDDVTLGLLRIVEHVGDQSAERLHGDVERQVHEQQDESPHGQRRESEQQRGVGHQGQSQSRDDGTAEDERNAAAEPGPGAVGKEPDDGLDDQAGDGSGQPEVAQVREIGAQRLEDGGGIGVLQRIADLNPEEAEAEVPYLPKGQFRFFHGSGGSFGFRFIKLKINIRKTERPRDERHDKTDERQLPGDESEKAVKGDPGETEPG